MENPHPPRRLLSEVPLYRRLSPDDLDRLADGAVLRTYRRGATLFSEGDPADQLFTIVRGRVKVQKMTPSGHELILEILGAGEPLGAVAVYEERPYPASAIALEATVCVLLDRQLFFELLERHPSMVRGLLASLTHRLVLLTTRLADLTGSRVESRFARLFLKLAAEIGRAENGGVLIPLPLSRRELADFAGTTIETSIRIMSRWGKVGIVRTERRGFTVLDTPELERRAMD